ncbi:tumor necrosis factor receptor superfamily member 17 isoform X5 [Vicugna pacos]|uniref:Tumor necrosis factor receptor superfamily member 17 isoform X5 n=1 Tax=Vicugna pacos TaxID=30538 RepID=A0ABM5BPG3_VICPA
MSVTRHEATSKTEPQGVVMSSRGPSGPGSGESADPKMPGFTSHPYPEEQIGRHSLPQSESVVDISGMSGGIRLLDACQPCRLRCSNTPPLTCQRYCNTMRGTNVILWTCLGLSLIVSLTVFVLMFLLRKMNSEPLKDQFKNTGLALLNEDNADVDDSSDGRTDAETLLSRGLEYTVEECTCEDCAKSKPKVDSDHFFPLPAMEEGATILVTTKTTDYCSSLLAAAGVLGMEKPISTI